MQPSNLNLIHDWGIGAKKSYCGGCASQAEGEI